MKLLRASAIFCVFACVIPSRIAAQADHHGAWTFESSGPEGRLVGWNATPHTVLLDSTVVHGGRYAAHLVRSPTDSPGGGAAILSMSLPVTFSGKTLELRGWLKTDDVTGFAGLWLREDGGSVGLQFDNMQGRHLAGTTGWTEYRIQLPLDRRARTLFLGALLAGGGDVWADDLDLLVDGRPIGDAPPRVPSPVELDTAFDSGSGIHTQSLSATQVRNLTLLGKVWGFVKYSHPRVVAGDVNWDYELFRVMPAVLRAPDGAAADRAMAEWLARLGDPPPCAPCATSPTGAYLLPDVAWIHDPRALGTELSHRLELIYDRRSTEPEQYYVSLNRGVGNPDFGTEAAYAHMSTPDAGFRLLALYRLWNIVEYWYPNRDIVGEDWDGVLADFVPRLMAAADHDAYRMAMMRLIARIHDTHANLWSDIAVRPPRGSAQLPVIVRFVQGKAVVTGYAQPTLGPATGLRVGDVIEAVDGIPIDSLVAAWRPYYADSNESARLRDMGRALTAGPEGPVRIRGRRASGAFDVTARRVPHDSVDVRAGMTHDLAGPAFRMLTPEVAYLKLSAVKNADMDDYRRQAADAKVLVIDIRNYPDEFVVFTLGGHLVTEPTPFARFTHGDMSNPGAFEWTEPVLLQPLRPHFPGKVVVLVDAVSQSQAEYTTMAFRAAGALVVGSTTAGADGNVSAIPLPGGLRTMISGIGVFYPDEKPTQRVGIVPDLEVTPTLAGIRAGRDEVLEAAVSRALGRPFTLKK
jgi:hypothetical protein